MMILTVKAVVRNGRKYLAGTAIDTDDKTAESLVQKGFAVYLDEPEEPAAAETETAKEPETEPETVTEEEPEGLSPEEIDPDAKMPEADEAACTVIRRKPARKKAKA